MLPCSSSFDQSTFPPMRTDFPQLNGLDISLNTHYNEEASNQNNFHDDWSQFRVNHPVNNSNPEFSPIQCTSDNSINDHPQKFNSNQKNNQCRKRQLSLNSELSEYSEVKLLARIQRYSVTSEGGTSSSSDDNRYDFTEMSPAQSDSYLSTSIGTYATSKKIASTQSRPKPFRMSIRLPSESAQRLSKIAKFHPEILKHLGLSAVKTAETGLIILANNDSMKISEAPEQPPIQVAPEIQVPPFLLGCSMDEDVYSVLKKRHINGAQSEKALKPIEELIDMPLREYLDIKYKKSTGIQKAKKPCKPKVTKEMPESTFQLPPISIMMRPKAKRSVKKQNREEIEAALKISQTVDDFVGKLLSTSSKEEAEEPVPKMKKESPPRKQKNRPPAPLNSNSTPPKIIETSQPIKVVDMRNDQGQPVKASLYQTKVHGSIRKMSINSSMKAMSMTHFQLAAPQRRLTIDQPKPISRSFIPSRNHFPSSRISPNIRDSMQNNFQKQKELLLEGMNLQKIQNMEQDVERQRREHFGQQEKERILRAQQQQQEDDFIAQFTGDLL